MKPLSLVEAVLRWREKDWRESRTPKDERAPVVVKPTQSEWERPKRVSKVRREERRGCEACGVDWPWALHKKDCPTLKANR